MNLLLDTHALIWFQENNPRLSESVIKMIQDTDNTVFFSQISLFEISIKQKIGKLPAFYASVEEVHNQAVNDEFSLLSIQHKQLFYYNKVPLKDDHRDPFDR